MLSRAQSLDAVTVGDLIFGLRDDGRPDLLLVYSADIASFLARNVLNQTTFRFGRDGEGRRMEDGKACTIVSTARLPPDLHEVAVGLDRRMGSSPEYPDTRLTEDEIRLVLTHDKFFEARLLPGTGSLVKRAQKLRAVTRMLMLEWDPADAPENPPSLSEYDDHVPALVDLLDRPASIDEVVAFLADTAARRMRPPEVAERSNVAAASLLQLRQSWV